MMYMQTVIERTMGLSRLPSQDWTLSTDSFQLGKLGTQMEFLRKTCQGDLPYEILSRPLPLLYFVPDHPCGYAYLIASLSGDWRQATATSKVLKAKKPQPHQKALKTKYY